MIAERTGRTVRELLHGGPHHEAMDAWEYTHWRALIEIVEPEERRQSE